MRIEAWGVVRGVGWDRPLNLAHAAWTAERVDDALGLLVGDQAGDTIHAGLPVDGVTEGRGDGFIQKKGAPVAEGGGVEEIERQVEGGDIGKDENPTMPQIRGGFEWSVGV